MAELYDLRNDPGERVNLIGRPAASRVIGELKAELARLMAETGLTAETDRMPIDAGIKKALPDRKIR